ncbi:hypothetical protein FHS40_009051, partial [Streptomyces spectabilis]
ATGEPFAGLPPDPLTKPLPLGTQPTTQRVSHTSGVPQGPKPVTTRQHPEEISSNSSALRAPPRGRDNGPAAARLTSFSLGVSEPVD